MEKEEARKTQMDRMEALLLSMDARLKRVEEELMIRKRKAVKRVQRSRAKAGGTLKMPRCSFGRDPRMPYEYWAKVMILFGQNNYLASEFCRWLINDWIALFALNNRKKIMSITSGRIRYFSQGAQVSAAEVDVFGRRNIALNPKRAHEVGEILFWDWTQTHFMNIRRNLDGTPGWDLLPTRFKKRIEFLWAPYSEVTIGKIKEYDPREPSHQIPLVGVYLSELFTQGFRLGLQNQRDHKAWCTERKIDILLRQLEEK